MLSRRGHNNFAQKIQFLKMMVGLVTTTKKKLNETNNLSLKEEKNKMSPRDIQIQLYQY
jgi:hypothetical protein